MSIYSRVREFLEEEDAKADDVEAEFDNIANFLEGGLTSDNIAAKGIAAKSIGDHVITGQQLAIGYNVKHAFGSIAISIPEGHQTGAQGTFAHSLGVTPSDVHFLFETGLDFAIALEGRLLSKDATNVTWQVVASSPMPFTFSATAFWHAEAIE